MASVGGEAADRNPHAAGSRAPHPGLDRRGIALASVPHATQGELGITPELTDGRVPLAINGRFLTQPTTGVQRVARELTREIDALAASGECGFDIRLLCEHDACLDDLALTAIRVERVGRLKGHGWEQCALPFAVGDATLLCLGNTAPVWSLARRRPVAVMIHDLSFRQYPEAYRLGYRIGHGLLTPLLLRRSAMIFAVSQSERRALAELAPGLAERIVLAPNGGWRDGASELPRRAPAEGYALYVGAFSRRKNFDRVLAAAIRLAREDGLGFRFVGSVGAILSPTTLDVPSDVRDRIRFSGHVERSDDLAETYRQARCLVFPSLYEASPLPPIEAMHFGCPVIASDIPAMRERCGDAAEYCDPQDTASIVAAVRRVANDPIRAAELVAHGWQQSGRFSWRAQARLVLAAIAAGRAANGPAGG